MPSTHETRFILTAKDKTKAVFGGFKGQLKDIGIASAQLAGTVIGLAGAAGFGLLGNGLIDTNIQFQTMKSSLKTLTGSTEAAAVQFDKIVKFATTTPFALTEVTDAFIKMKALGLDPSEEAITAYGNTAAAMGKSLNQMIEAVADASTGEFERLKEFGITAKSQGEFVTFTFQGVSTKIGKNAEEITGYLQSIGNTNFAGAMVDQMDNLGPAFDNFGTAIDLLQTSIGEAGLNDALATTTNTLTDFITELERAGTIGDATRATLELVADTLGLWDATTEKIGEGMAFIAKNTGKQFTGEGGIPVPAGFNGLQLGQVNPGFESLEEAIGVLQAQQGKDPQLAQQISLLQKIESGIRNASGVVAQ